MWMKKGYQIVVTADHGMNHFHTHNGTSDSDQLVPLYIFSDKVAVGDYRLETSPVPQLEMAPFLCELLAIPKSDKMITVQSIKWKGTE